MCEWERLRMKPWESLHKAISGWSGRPASTPVGRTFLTPDPPGQAEHSLHACLFFPPAPSRYPRSLCPSWRPGGALRFIQGRRLGGVRKRQTLSQAAAEAAHLRRGRASMGLLSAARLGRPLPAGSGLTVPAEPVHECCCARPRGPQWRGRTPHCPTAVPSQPWTHSDSY